MPPAPKRRKLSPKEDSDVDSTEAENDDILSTQGSLYPDQDYSVSGHSSPDTEDEIVRSHLPQKSKKTAKRKHRAVEAGQFGSTLRALLDTDAPTDLPLSLKPSVGRKRNDEKLEVKAKKALEIERKEREEVGRVRDVIGGWGGESERALRKVAQRGVVKLFNVIQQAQSASENAAAEALTKKGSGKPRLPAPSTDDRKVKSKKKDTQKGPNVALDTDDFLDMIRSGGLVAKS